MVIRVLKRKEPFFQASNVMVLPFDMVGHNLEYSPYLA